MSIRNNSPSSSSGLQSVPPIPSECRHVYSVEETGTSQTNSLIIISHFTFPFPDLPNDQGISVEVNSVSASHIISKIHKSTVLPL